MGELLRIARAIILFIILRILLRALFGSRTPSGGRSGSGGVRGGFGAGPTPFDPAQNRPDQPTERVGGELVRDPQCGTYVAKSRAIVVTRNGETLYFCSAKCRDDYGR